MCMNGMREGNGETREIVKIESEFCCVIHIIRKICKRI